jgi:glycerol kinase
MKEQYILTIDQGTSSTKTVIFNSHGNLVAKATTDLRSYFPQIGFVEQNPKEIYHSTLESVNLCLKDFMEKTSGNLEQIVACGIANQRETFVLWDESGNPLSNAVVWQCKRSVGICDRLKESGIEEEIKARTGLIIDPYFSGTKLIWLWENDKQIKNGIKDGKAYFGTVDSWLLFKLTKGQSYYTDYTNACRTLFFNINDLQWDKYLLNEFQLSKLHLPEPKPSSFFYGETDFDKLLPRPVRISSMIGDSHAAAFGEGCFAPGTAKATLGTGSSILMNTGSQKIASQTGMVATICWSTADRVDYALEGIIVTCGATIVWLRDQLGLFEHSRETEALALGVENSNGVYFIPAFSGLGAPHWKMNAKAAILGLTFGCHKNHIVRAALESIPFQIKDVIAAMEKDSGITLKELNVDGGITANRFVMQCLTDVLNTKVVNIGFEDVTSLGAAYLAGLECGMFADLDQLQNLGTNKNEFTPGKNRDKVSKCYEEWENALKGLFYYDAC